MTKEIEIPKFIIKKLQSIEQHQYAVKKLLGEIEAWKPELEKSSDPKSFWNFSMWIDQQGMVTPAKQAELLLYQFLNKKFVTNEEEN